MEQRVPGDQRRKEPIFLPTALKIETKLQAKACRRPFLPPALMKLAVLLLVDIDGRRGTAGRTGSKSRCLAGTKAQATPGEI